MIKIGAWESSSNFRLFRAFSAWHFRVIQFLGRWPRLLHFAPLALGDSRPLSAAIACKVYCIPGAYDLANLRSCQRLCQLKLLTILRHFNLPTEAIANVAGHSICGLRFTVSYEHPARWQRHILQPAHHFFSI